MKLNTVTTLQSDDHVEEVKELPVRTIHESVFWEEDDPRWTMTGLGSPQFAGEGSHILDMGVDSYIWAFTGGRGAGKTTLMTFFSMKVNWLYGYRIIANYPIEYILATIDGKKKRIQAEPLDLYRLLCFDSDYHDCLILIDEAPDIISHMSSQSWKNRLLNIFIRQLRKNHNSLFLGAQQFEIIDKSMRWQTDILAQCEDASRKYGWAPSERGKVILCHLLDNSSMWLGETWEQEQARIRATGHYEEVGERLEIFPRGLWAPNGCKPVFDSYYQQDVWESLKKVDMKLMTYEVGQREAEVDLEKTEWLQRAAPVVTAVCGGDQLVSQTKQFFASVGALTTKEKDALSKRLNEFNVRVGQDGTGKRYYDFTDFDLFGFLGKTA